MCILKCIKRLFRRRKNTPIVLSDVEYLEYIHMTGGRIHFTVSLDAMTYSLIWSSINRGVVWNIPEIDFNVYAISSTSMNFSDPMHEDIELMGTFVSYVSLSTYYFNHRSPEYFSNNSMNEEMNGLKILGCQFPHLNEIEKKEAKND